MKPLFSQKFAILTAENPRYGSVEGGNAALEQEMKAKGLKFTFMKGKYGTSENSYLVENPDHQDVLSWGKKYGQDSVIVSDGGHHKMIYTNGPHEGLWHEGHSVSIHDKEPEDFYSTINLNNKPTHFTIDFDMDKKHGATMKKSLTKMLKSLFTPKLPLYSEYVEPLEKSEKLPHFLKFMGDHPKAQETAQWADDNIKHRNLAELAMRHAKTKPEGLNEEEKTHIKHFNDSLHMPEVQKAAGMLTNKHDFNSGIGLLKDAEAAYQKRHAAEAPTLVPTEGIKVLDFGDGVGVYNLGKSKNENEATGMGHCATPHEGGELWSIRRNHGNGMVEPLVTISHEGGYIGEMKGKHNWKPSDRHHIHIAKLLASDKIKGFVGGGYAPESNFEISDLKEGLRKKLLEHKPSLVQQVYKETLPKGFQGNYSHVPEIKSIFNTNNLEAQKKYLQKFSKDIKKHIEIRRSVAKHPNTHPDILHKLSTDNYWNVRSSVAKHPNTHPDILHKLSTDNYWIVRSSVAENPNTHPDILHKLSTDSDDYVRRSVAENPNTHPDILHKLSTDSEADVRRSVAKHPNTHPDILHKLSTDNYWNVRSSVAENPNTHPDILHKLSTDSEADVRRSVAKHPNTHPDILHKLSTDSEADVRRSVAKHPNTHSDILHKLSTDNNDYVRSSVAENPQFKNLPPEIKQNIRPLINTHIQKIIAMINDGERNPDAAHRATEELKIRRKEKYDKILSPEGNLNDIQHLAESHDNDIAKRAREELKRRGLQKSLKKSDSPKHLIHFSTTPNLTTLDPEFQGTAGRHSPETKHGKPTHPRVYFYEEGTPTESVVTGGAKSKYVVKHPGHDKIIDIANDLENQQQAKQQWLQKPIGSMQDAYFKLLKDKGYLGFKNSASGLPNVVAMFHATPVHAEIPMPKDMAANPDWTKAEVPMSLKKSDVKEAVEKIKGPAKVNEVLSEAKPDMRSKILAALRKEKLAKMNGTGTPGAGGATPPMMRPPVPAAPASMAMSKADESESRMAKKDLKDIMEYAQALDKMVVESEDLEDWVDSKITVARQYLSDIAHYLSYENGQPTEELDKAESNNSVQFSHDFDEENNHLIVFAHKNGKIVGRVSFNPHPEFDPKEKIWAATDAEVAETNRRKGIATSMYQYAASQLKGHRIVPSDTKSPKGQAFWHGLNAKGRTEFFEDKLNKGDVISMKDKKVISTDTKAAPKKLVTQQPKAAKNERALAQRVKSNWEGPRPELAKSDSKKAKFERCVLAVKKKSGKEVNPWAVCHASVDGAKKSEDLEKADMKVKEQEKPTKGMPQAKQLKADADLEKIKEGAENVAKAADKKKSELNKSGYFKEDKKTQLPKWHDPLKGQRESAAQEEQELRPESKMHIWAMLEREKQRADKAKTQKPKEELEKKFSLKGALAVGALGAASLSGGAHASPESDLHSKLSNLNVMGEYHTPKSGSKAVLKEPSQLKANPAHPQTSYMSESKDKTVSGRFHGPDAEKAKKLLADYESANKSEELEKGKNVRKQRETVFGGWKTSAGSPRREKQIAALADMIKRRFGLEAKRAPGKVAASGKVIDKPNFHDNVVEHIGNPDSLAHEVGHLYQYGKDMESIDPRKEFKTKEQLLSDWQKDMDAHWGDLNVKHGYKKQAQTAEEYEPTALENYYRRRAGLPTHQKTASTEEENRIESEKRGKKYKKPAISRTQAVDDPSKEIVQKVKVKGKDGQEKEIWLTGSTKNLTNKTRELVDQIDRGELMLDPTRGFVEGTSVDAKINRRARAASQDKTRKDADTLMRSDEVLEKKLILGEGKPSKATKKATPEEHKAIMDKLSAALDTVKVDTSPEAAKERKMLLEHVKHKLKGQK